MPILTDPDHLIRLTDARYGDGFSTLVDGVDAVAIAQTVFDQEGLLPSAANLSEMFVSWGQFIDHDLSLTRDNSGELVQVPGLAGPLDRSAFDPATGTTDARQQVNEITPEIDASHIYGSTSDRTDAVRSFTGGKLAVGEDTTSDFGLLPLAGPGVAMAAGAGESPVFLAGDVRANENTGLTLLHTVFVREHNYWADRLSVDNPGWTDEEVFQAARSIVEFEMQKITYDEWLPHLIADATDTVTPTSTSGQVSTEFSTAAFRFGHTMVSTDLLDLQEDGTVDQVLTVRDQFFNTDAIRDAGIAGLLRGQAAGVAQELDTKVIDDLNFFLTLGNGASGFSLPALNIVRGRDHGLESYLQTRATVVGDIDEVLFDATDFSIITSDASVQAELQAAYGTVDQVDLWVGGLAEDAIAGTQLGVTFTTIIADQFARTRAADGTFGDLDESLSAEIIADVHASTFSDVLVRTTNIDDLQTDPFEAMIRIGGTLISDTMRGGREAELMTGLEGRDDLRGGAGDDELRGGAGDDALRGQMGDDILRGGENDDFLSGSQGNDLLDGGDGNDIIRAGWDNDTIFGGAGDDRVRGGKGDDLIDTGSGNDRSIGDKGADTFVFATGNDIDMIMDFTSGEDLIDLTGAAVADFAALSALAVEGKNRVTFDIGDDTLILRKLLLADLAEDDFIFA